MTRNRFVGKNIPAEYDQQKAIGTPVVPGIYLAVVKAVVDPDRSGRLQVWIPQLGGIEDDDKNWKLVRYASPFLGSTQVQTGNANEQSNSTNQFSYTSQTYGFWAVPPDIGNQVLVAFTGGDVNQSAFWFACVFDRKGHHMTPGIPGGRPDEDFVTNSIQEPNLKSIVKATKDGNFPLGEFNERETSADPLFKRKKVVHEYVAKSYIEQGIESDIVRGAGRSSSQRDQPSAVYGWSTPGRPLNDQGNLKPDEKSSSSDKKIYGRKGGHSFVMDDGDFYGQSQRMKFRTSGGHTILMDDTNDIFYIINKQGSCWIEMTGGGQINLYSGGGFNLRTRGDLNFHSDKKVNIWGDKGVSIRSNGDFTMEGAGRFGITGGDLTLFGDKQLGLLSEKGSIIVDASAKLVMSSGGVLSLDSDIRVAVQDGLALAVKPPKGLSLYTHNDTKVQGDKWTVVKNETESIVSVLTTHEPWSREGYDSVTGQSMNVAAAKAPRQTYTGKSTQASQIFASANPDAASDLSSDYLSRYPGVEQGTRFALGSQFIPKTDSYNALNAPRSAKGVGTLPADTASSLKTSLAYLETRGAGTKGEDYAAVNRFRYMGRYQHGAAALEDAGYLKPGSFEAYGNKAVDRADCWSGKGGVNSAKDYLTNPSVQESVQDQLTAQNYKTLLASGVITPASPPEHVAGVLAVAHNQGAGGAIRWAKTGEGRDGFGTPASLYYAAGRYAVINKVSYG